MHSHAHNCRAACCPHHQAPFVGTGSITTSVLHAGCVGCAVRMFVWEISDGWLVTRRLVLRDMSLRCVCSSSLIHAVGYTEKAEQNHQHQETKARIKPAEDDSKKQCQPNETRPGSNLNTIHPCKRHNNPIHGQTPSRVKSTHTCRPYAGMRPHARGQPATQYLHTQTVTTRRGCGCNGMHEAPHELSVYRGNGIASDHMESKFPG